MTHSPSDLHGFLERAAGSLAGVAIGDALGMPVEFLSREEISSKFGRVDRFLEPPAGHIHEGVRKGSITDDTQQTWALSQALVDRGHITPEIAAEAYLRWARETNAFQSTFLGPSSKEALLRLKAGEDPRLTGKGGATVGSAMRVSPIGIVNAGEPMDAAKEAYNSSLPTHGVNISIAGACAVAAGVASAAGGSSLDDMIEAIIRGAEFGQGLGVKSPGATLTARLHLAVKLARENLGDPLKAEAVLCETVGVSMNPIELVATAVGLLVLYDADPTSAIPAAASMGGDTDTLAAIVGGLSGAMRGIEALPGEWVSTVEQVNGLDFKDMGKKLITVWEKRRAHSK
jgi:ADP-ribosylglycohydrolase